MGETRIDLVHLLEDLADAYPGDLEETVLTEIVANALDSGATRIELAADPQSSTMVVVDNGSGMRRADLRRFHDVASSAKVRGEGIGFAGVGIKLGLLVGQEVMTESRRGKEHIATAWALAGRRRAPWRWIEPPGLVAERGTAVRLTPQNALSPLLDAGYVETMLRRHFEPLFDPLFDEILSAHYPNGVTFVVNGRELERRTAATNEDAPISVRLARKRKASAWGCLSRTAHAAPEDRRGLAISTYGKVIKRGWDWLGITPSDPERISGLVEVPSLAAALTLNKVDFLRSGPRGALYLAYRKALQEAVAAVRRGRSSGTSSACCSISAMRFRCWRRSSSGGRVDSGACRSAGRARRPGHRRSWLRRPRRTAACLTRGRVRTTRRSHRCQVSREFGDRNPHPHRPTRRCSSRARQSAASAARRGSA